jgi:hypothetical protein
MDIISRAEPLDKKEHETKMKQVIDLKKELVDIKERCEDLGNMDGPIKINTDDVEESDDEEFEEITSVNLDDQNKKSSLIESKRKHPTPIKAISNEIIEPVGTESTSRITSRSNTGSPVVVDGQSREGIIFQQE